MNFARSVPKAAGGSLWRVALRGDVSRRKGGEQEKEAGFPSSLCGLRPFYLYHGFIVSFNVTPDFFNSFFKVWRVFSLSPSIFDPQ